MSAILETPSVPVPDSPVSDVDTAWCDELERRIDDVSTGRVQMLDMDESHSRIRARLADQR